MIADTLMPKDLDELDNYGFDDGSEYGGFVITGSLSLGRGLG